MTTDDDGTRAVAVDDAGDEERAAPDGRGPTTRRPSGEPAAAVADRTFDWRGWFLVAVVAVAFLVVPVAILVLPSAQGFVGSLGLSLRDAYLTLPMVPALLLGAVAVWSAVRARDA